MPASVEWPAARADQPASARPEAVLRDVRKVAVHPSADVMAVLAGQAAIVRRERVQLGARRAAAHNDDQS